MSATIIDGKATAKEIRDEIARTVAAATEQGHRPPGLGVILVGEDPASKVYVGHKERACAEAGFHSVKINPPAEISQAELIELVRQLNEDPAIDGFLVQSPLPPHLDETAVTLAIDPDKDVDGFHPVNVGRLSIGLPGFVPCTPKGVMVLLERWGIEVEGRHAVVLGRSNIVGKPMAMLLMQKAKGANATVTVAHSRTRDLPAVCRQADILVAAIGMPRFVGADFVKEGAVVIDVGVNRIEDRSRKSGTRLVGDVDYEHVLDKVSAITPVPGGVGPMTIAMLLQSTMEQWQRKLGI